MRSIFPLLTTLLTVLPAAIADICEVADKVNAFNNFQNVNLQGACDGGGSCSEGCVMYMESAACSPEGFKDQAEDLMIGIGKMVEKDGRLETVTQGNWILSWEGFTSAVPNRDIAQVFQASAIVFQRQGNDFLPTQIYFVEVADGDGGTYRMQAQNTCKQ